MDDLIFLPPDRWGRTGVERRTVRGELIAADRSAFSSDKDFSRVAGALDVPKAQLMCYVDDFRRLGTAKRSLAPAQAEQPRFWLAVRGRTQRLEDTPWRWEGEPAECFAKALALEDPLSEPLIVWPDRAAVAAVDVDFPGEPPGEPELFCSAELVEPRASYYWRTRHGGLRLVYFAGAGFAAVELAAVAVTQLRSRFPGARVEVKRDTRHPHYPDAEGRTCSRPTHCTATADVSSLARHFADRRADDPQALAWLAERGMQPGGRYGHEKCPIQPSDEAGQSTLPVMVCDDHVHCFKCEANGVRHGSRVPGRFPFSGLTGVAAMTALAQCVRGFAHWSHARHVVAAALGEGDEDLSRALYSAALKLRHGDDPRCSAVFTQGLDLIRLDGRWATGGGEEYRVSSMAIRPILASLPACQRLDAVSGELRADMRIVAKFEQPHDLWEWGYPALFPVWAMRVYGHFLGVPDPTRVPVVMQVAQLAPPPMAQFRPRYLPPGARLDNAWEVVERVLPGVERRAIRLLLAAKGCAEGGTGMPPLVVITGPSGAGKTSVIEAAAAIAGDSFYDVQWNQSDERLRQGVMEAKRHGTYCCFNEFFKSARGNKRSSADGLNFLLGLTPDSASHKLYVGPVRLGALPVCVWTDVAVPDDVKNDVQLARRLTHVHLPRRMEWASSRAATIGDVRNLRTHSPEYARACDTILSEVIDQFFRAPQTFAQVAEQLGYRQLERSSEREWSRDLLREFFAGVCALPESGSRTKRRHRGWKLVDLHQDTATTRAWRRLRDPEDPADSRKCKEVDWQELCGLEVPGVFECRAMDPPTCNRMEVRFFHEADNGDITLNEEMLSGGKADLPGLRDHQPG